MIEIWNAIKPFAGALFALGGGGAFILTVLVIAITRPDNKQFHQEYKEAKKERGYYPSNETVTTEDVKTRGLGVCVGGCSTAFYKPDRDALAKHQNEQKDDLHDRYSRGGDTKHVSRPQSDANKTDAPIPARSWPVKIDPIPNGIPLPEEQPERVSLPLWRR